MDEQMTVRWWPKSRRPIVILIVTLIGLLLVARY